MPVEQTPTRNSWRAMRSRCLSPTDKDYPNYGGRGITVCSEWDRFAVFLQQMGERPEGKTLGRIDNDGPYSVENCVWETIEEQNRNKRSIILLTYKGLTMCLAEWARHFEVEYTMLHSRWRKNPSTEYVLRELAAA